MHGVALLPPELGGAQEGTGGLFPPADRAPLVVEHRQVAVGLDDLGIVLTEQRLGGRADAEPLRKLLGAAVGHPRDLGGKALDMVLLPLQEALGDEHRHHDVFMPGFFEHAVEQVADVFPDRGAVGAHDHAAAHARVIREVGLANDISIPFGKIDIHRGDVVHHLLFVVRHDFSSLISVIEPYYYNGFPEKMQEKAVFVSVADRCIRKISGGFTGSPAGGPFRHMTG